MLCPTLEPLLAANVDPPVDRDMAGRLGKPCTSLLRLVPRTAERCREEPLPCWLFCEALSGCCCLGATVLAVVSQLHVSSWSSSIVARTALAQPAHPSLFCQHAGLLCS